MRGFACLFLLFSRPKSGRLPPARANLLGTSATRPADQRCCTGKPVDVRDVERAARDNSMRIRCSAGAEGARSVQRA